MGIINSFISFVPKKLIKIRAFDKYHSKESRSRGRGFDLPPEGVCDACYFSVFWNNGVME